MGPVQTSDEAAAPLLSCCEGLGLLFNLSKLPSPLHYVRSLILCVNLTALQSTQIFG